MMRFVRYHGAQTLVLAGMVAAAATAYDRLYSVSELGISHAGVLYRCSQPRGGDWRLLRRYKIQTLINLRCIGEGADIFGRPAAECVAAGASMVNIPVGHEPPKDEHIAAFLREVRGRRGAVLVHCKHGVARTGYMVAAYRIVVQGWPVRKAVVEMERFRCRRRGARQLRLLRLLHRLHRDRAEWLRRTDPNAPATDDAGEIVTCGHPARAARVSASTLALPAPVAAGEIVICGHSARAASV